MTGLSIVGSTYLVWLAYRIATAPVGSPSEARPAGFAATASGGYLLGVTNPKAYIAFVSLMASYAIVHANPLADVSFKWMACVIIVLVVDVIWLWVGAIVGKANLGRRTERSLNVLMGSTVLAAAALSWI
jgi:threonine/homoserine/homoserine lactone efflux protein